MPIIRPESALYPLVANWIHSHLRTSELNFGDYGNQQVFMANTAQAPAADGGYWSRPDLAAILYYRPRFVPTWSASLYTFEVKTADGINEAAVYEAVAHRRYANYSVLVWQTDGNDAQINQITELCKQFGVGALAADDPTNPSSYRVLNIAERSEINPVVVDQFIDYRFPTTERIRLENWLNENGWNQEEREGQI